MGIEGLRGDADRDPRRPPISITSWCWRLAWARSNSAFTTCRSASRAATAKAAIAMAAATMITRVRIEV